MEHKIESQELRSLMRDIENSAIDKGEWLNSDDRKEFLKIRSGRGEIKEINNRYFCSTVFAYDDLARFPESRPILDATQLSSAEFFTTLHEVISYKTGYQRLRVIAESLHGGGGKMPHGFCAETLGCIIQKNMERWEYALCERLCLQPLRSNDWGWVILYKEGIRGAFDGLGKSIEKSIDILKERLENSRNEEGRNSPKINP